MMRNMNMKRQGARLSGQRGVDEVEAERGEALFSQNYFNGGK